MPLHARPLRLAVAGATAVTLVAAVPSAAQAARPKPVHKAFTAHGLVVRHTSSSVTLLASAVKSGRHRSRNTTVTVALPSRRTATGRALAKRLAHTHAGDGITVTGTTVAGKTVARNFAARPAPFHAYLGTVTAINDNLVTLTKAGEPSDDAREDSQGSFTVDTSDANVSLDGQPVGGALDLKVGETAAVLGSSVEDAVVATSVFAFTTAPDAIAGEVTAVDGPTLTVAPHGDHGQSGSGMQPSATTDDPGAGDGQSGDGGDATVQVSVDSATLIVDGASDAPVTAVTAGARVLALGVDHGNGSFDSALAFVFTHGCNSRHHGDGGQGSDDGH